MIRELILYRHSAGRWLGIVVSCCKKYLVDAEKEEQTVRQLYLRSEQRLQANDWIRIAHISKYLPQNVGRQDELRVLQQMDSVYAALQGGAEFFCVGLPVFR